MKSIPDRRSLLGTLFLGFIAGILAGGLMLVAMASLRLIAGVPTPTEMIFDRIFPFLTVDFFISSLVKAGGYTPLKLDGVYGALAGHLLVAGLAGMVYALYLRGRPGRAGGRLVLIGVMATTLLFTVLLWPNLLTSYRGLPPGRATVLSTLGMLLSFAVCGLGLMAFHKLLAGQEAACVDRTETLEESDVNKARTASAAGVGRRAFLAGGIGAGLAVVLGGLLHRLYRLGTFSYDGRQYGGPGVQKITPIRPEDQFYQVSKNLVDPDPARSLWRLEIGGQVDNPRSYTFADLLALPAVEQETTLMCISYGVGSGLCSNARWKGVPLVSLLDQAKPWGDNAAILFYAADGYHETFDFDKALESTTLLAYEMNGEPLPQRHGFPVRLIVPGIYGEKSAKWVTRIEVLDRADPRLTRPKGLGFYHEQGWGPKDVIPTHSRIDAPRVEGDHFTDALLPNQPVELRGMAFGGDRGISKVEISTDDGKNWAEAEIFQPGTKISWSLWRFLWVPAAPSDDVRVVVRATDGDGQLQIAENRPPVPHGSTGLHRVRAQVRAPGA